MKEAQNFTKLMVRIPAEAKAFVEREASRNRSSQNSEIVRSIVERMNRVQREEMPDPAGE